MTWAAKLRIISSVTIIMAIGFIMMKEVPVGRTVLAVIWCLHLIYFIFGIRTIKAKE